ncbi:hypothetical protein GJ496_004244 [Pomphorhynchus laevis]|nr:hypothetical protein GJ496_004244 [Pomphorhynchus laevis]
MKRDVSSSNLRELVEKLKPDSIAKEIERVASSVRLIHDVYIRKVKVLRKPKFDLTRLLYMHGEGSGGTAIKSNVQHVPLPDTFGEDEGTEVEKTDYYEPPIQEAV